MDSATVPESDVPPKRHHRVLIITSIVIVISLIAILVVGSIILLRRSPDEAEPTSNTISTLPEADSGGLGQDDTVVPPTENSSTTPATTPTPSPTTTPATITVPSTVERQVQESLGVVIEYQQGNQFDLAITSVYRTRQIPTAQFLAPANEFQPYSILRLYDQQGNSISEHRFTMPTTITLESAEASGATVHRLPNSELTIVIPIPADTSPSQIRVVGSAGQQFDVTSFTYEQLERKDPIIPSEATSWLPHIPVAHAAEDPLKIVVITQGAGFAVDRVADAANGLKNIAPWSTYASDITVARHSINLSMGCNTIDLGTGIAYPHCGNSGQVIHQAQLLEPDWDAIVVVMPVDCNCGTSYPGSRITTVGQRAGSGLLAHEYGHGLGAMTDEYLYQYNLVGAAGPNCFASAAACESAIAPYAGDPAAQCSLGCNAPQTYRPANRIMHNQYNILEYGPVEQCFMGSAIAAILNRVHICTTNQAEDPTGEYWGGGR